MASNHTGKSVQELRQARTKISRVLDMTDFIGRKFSDKDGKVVKPYVEFTL
jgi:hypothetical protein